MIIRGFEDLKEKPKMETRQRAQWANEIKLGVRSAYQPSPIYIWYHEENAKRMKGEQNEIDINEIVAAASGVKNRWHDRVKKNPALYVPVIEGRDYDWQAIVSG